MARTLLVTNDFPPTIGGIQSYLRDFVETLPADDIVVFASTQNASEATRFDARADYRIVRWPRMVMLPTSSTVEAMSATIEEFGIETVWFGASAPLGLLADAARHAGARRIVASTHGHEVGWAKAPGARQLLRRIGGRVDVVTYISDYTRRRIQPALGDHPEYVALPSGVDTEYFQPIDPAERAQIRSRHGFGAEPLVVCISRLVRRKGQDQLLRAWPEVMRRHPDARLVIVGEGPYRPRLRRMARELPKRAVTFTGAMERSAMRDLLAAADVAAVPARTRLGGLDVEGLGIVYLEAQAAGVPVIAGDSGGAPETVRPDTGVVVPGRATDKLARAVAKLLDDPARRKEMGEAGRRHAVEAWSRERMAKRLAEVLNY
ncbi:alpha-(1-2)-phosphatidylinositol mannosyltransferase [Corynebacterium yudongzhengii]|uniref:Glycosyltransferase family 1 protein n=1 Tax=Corynebacterium yudongzhengii TaxID=2080740 RepID=A0A2U1T7B0_9CORY|nr:glycosyltransferase family 4 protein [Corynebacterium yudongzhengii]AWB81550.1 alpha-(1-2)-phosphatidylinositol mannosyltransferase [Corynebacterium yudongzhengii]PWC01879.1 glycosyltransferase family 1 protein [Corynebacterium yudongzhengii]